VRICTSLYWPKDGRRREKGKKGIREKGEVRREKGERKREKGEVRIENFRPTRLITNLSQISPLRPAPIDIRLSLNVDLQRMIAGEE